MDQYGNSKMGFKKYKDPKIFRSSGEELFTKDFLENYMSDLHINFTSSEGRAESYNMFHRGKEKHRFFEKFISANPNTGGHFKTRSSASDEIIDGEDKDAEQVDTEEEEEEGERSTMHLLGRRNLSSGFYNHEMVCELAERGRLEEAIFGPKESPVKQAINWSSKRFFIVGQYYPTVFVLYFFSLLPLSLFGFIPIAFDVH